VLQTCHAAHVFQHLRRMSNGHDNLQHRWEISLSMISRS
jgi:hypothetical protein